MTMLQKAGLLVAVVGVVGVAALLSTSAQAKQGIDLNPQPLPPRWLPGLVGLASTQRARLSVVSLLPAPQPGAAAGDPTAVELTFFSDQGSVIATSQVQVGPGGSQFLDIGFADAVNAIPPAPNAGAPINRVEIRAAAVGMPVPRVAGPPPPYPPNPCRMSLEIYDPVTGITAVALVPAVQ